MAITKKDANAKYDKLRAQLKKGDISKEAFKAASNRIYKMYHSDANKATRNAPKAKPAAKTKPAAKAKPAAKKPSVSNARHSSMRKGVMYGQDVDGKTGKPKQKPSSARHSSMQPGKMYGQDVDGKTGKPKTKSSSLKIKKKKRKVKVLPTIY